MRRLPPAMRVLALAACGGLMSCTSVLRTQVSREETRLTDREKRHMAGLLEEMASGWDGMRLGKISERRKAQDRYDKVLADFLREWDRHQSPRYWQSGTVFASKKQSFSIEFDAAANQHFEVPPPQIDQLILPYRMKPRVTDTEAQRPGVGVPVVGHIRRTSEVRAEQPFLPPNGGNLTLTAVMEVGDAPADALRPRRCRLHLHNTLNVDTVKLRDDERQLAANFTASKQLALSKKSLNLFKWLGLLYPERTLADCQLYRMDVYDPKRIPVVFVHGLMSDPHIWLNVVNAISADPELRAAYQPWYFLYPSALGITQSSAKLRDSLRQILDHFDPDHNDPGPKNMVLVGHSMGGLLSRMQAIDPGDKLWNALLSDPPEKLRISDATKERLTQNLRFKAQPGVKRLIFITTPHRGSNIASKGIVRRLSSLIRLPFDTLRMSQELLSGNTDALSPEIRDWGIYSFLSLGMLSDKHPFYKGLNAVPIPVAHHSIIAQFGKNSRLKDSDGVVPYWSSHLDTAESEKIVRAWHGCVEKPEVVQEIVRVLREHLREKGTPSKQR
jgi:pimeloyl-ACP methyl ester carboxylesterase